MKFLRTLRTVSPAPIPGLLALSLTVAAFAPQALAQQSSVEEQVEEVVVQSTRSGRDAQHEPIRVEVLDRDEVEEKLLMTPGNIAMLVNETPGVRTQITSPSLGGANIRMQGMKGRYTQLLSDGLPFYGGQVPAIGLLQVAPTDLGQVEIIKGAASALYGPSALGGVINLISRRPSATPQSELLVNATSRGGADFTGYNSASFSDEWGYSVTGGFDRQDRHDLNRDGWADMPGYSRWSLRPRLFWDDANGSSVYVTTGAMTESRHGGTMLGRVAPDGFAFPQSLDTKRLDEGLVAQSPIADWATFHFRSSAMSQDDRHLFGNVLERDHHQTLFGEATVESKTNGTSWLAGVAFQGDRYISASFPQFDYTNSVPALLAQVEHDLLDDLTLAASARWDDHNRYGSHFSPRLSALYRPGLWTFRASIGQGFFAPTPFVEGIDEVGLSRLTPLNGLKAETATTASLDAGYISGAFRANVTLFTSDINNAVQIDKISTGPGSGIINLFNAPSPTQTRGGEFMLRYGWDAFTVTASYVFVDASEARSSLLGRRAVPLTPKNTAGLVAMWEEQGVGRIGLESYYTGRQFLEDNPYRNSGKPYVELGLFGEAVLGKFRLFVNAENLLDVRQTKYDPLLLPQRAADGRWTVDAWAPTEGFVINGGVRVLIGE
jgi:outer membrane receptor for ferrienterochelin and colicins